MNFKITHTFTALGIVTGLTVFALSPPMRAMPWTPARVVGVALMAVGLVFVFVARFQLGSAFAVRAKATTLVTHGLYSRIRNPIYVFSSLFILGLALYVAQPILLGLCAGVVVLQTVRAKKEAQVLEEKFGDEYRNYKKRTWF